MIDIAKESDMLPEKIRAFIMNDFSGPHITQPLIAWYRSEVQSPPVAPARQLAGQSCLVVDVVDKFTTKQ